MSTCPGCLSKVPDELSYCPECGGKLTPKSSTHQLEDSLLGSTIAGKFLVESVIGQGAMGKVYRAKHIGLDRLVAVKVLHQHLAGDRIIVRRFHREARAASRLNHPNSVQIIDFGQSEAGTLYIAMEYIEGRDLLEILDDSFPIPLDRIVNLMSQTLEALDEAHAAGIVHRDLKPENIMVLRRRDGREEVKVCDFGIAKIHNPGDSEPGAPVTVAGLVCGTPEYMSPEQCRGEKLDGRADVYSAGVILYQLVTNDLPFKADSPLGVVTRQLTDEPEPPSKIAPELQAVQMLENVILKALSKKRDARQKDALELKADLEHAVAGEVMAPPAKTTAPFPEENAEPAPPPDAVPASRWPIIAASLVTALVVFFAAWLLLPLLADEAEPQIVLASEPISPPRDAATVDDEGNDGGGVSHEGATGGLASENNGDAGSEESSDGDVDGGALERQLARPAGPKKAKNRWNKTGSLKRPHKGSVPTKSPSEATEQPRSKVSQELPEATPSELGQRAFRAGDCTTAVRHFERARQANPGNAQIHFMLGRCYFRIGQAERGRSAYRRYLELRPNASNRAFIEDIIRQN